MTRAEPTCPLCGAVLSCDMCGPIEGGQAWIREGERSPSAFHEGEAGEWVYACDRCLGRGRSK
jgi:hypothetical protein